MRFRVLIFSVIFTACIITMTFFVVQALKEERDSYYRGISPMLDEKTINGLQCALYNFKKKDAYDK